MERITLFYSLMVLGAFRLGLLLKTEFLLNNIDSNSIRTSQETQYVSTTKPNRLLLFRETVAVYCENHTEHTNTLCGQNAQFWYVI
jgi:hypothetical protein